MRKMELQRERMIVDSEKGFLLVRRRAERVPKRKSANIVIIYMVLFHGIFLFFTEN